MKLSGETPIDGMMVTIVPAPLPAHPLVIRDVLPTAYSNVIPAKRATRVCRQLHILYLCIQLGFLLSARGAAII